MYLIRKKNKVLYKHIEGDKYKNLATGVCGVLKEDEVNQCLSMPVNYNYIFLKYPLILELIDVLSADAIMEFGDVKLIYNHKNKTLIKWT